MKILIIEDEINAANRLKNILQKINNQYQFLNILCSIEDSVKWFSTNPSPDLVFMDIQLADGLSFRIFDKVKIDCPIIFTTAFDEYAIQAFEVNSIDYLLKPINEERLLKSIQKLNSLKGSPSSNIDNSKIFEILKAYQDSGHYKNRFLIHKADGLVIVPTDDIAYFHAGNKEVQLTTSENKQYFMNESLEKLEKQLNPKIFFRLNRQLIISIHSINKITNYFNYKLKLTLKPLTEFEIIVGRKKVKDFKDWVNK